MAFPSGKIIQTNELLSYYLTLNMNSICRVCLEKGPKMMQIFDPVKPAHFSVLLMACAQIQVAEGDGLPPFICHKCISKLNIAYQFKMMCESSDNKLRQCFENFNRFSQNSEVTTFIDVKKDGSNSNSYPTTNDEGGGMNNNHIHASEVEIDSQAEVHKLNSETDLIYAEHSGKILQQDVGENNEIILGQTEDIIENDKPESNLEYKIELNEYKPFENLKQEELTLSMIEQTGADTVKQKNNKNRKPKKEHICDVCGKMFRKKPSLVHHIRIHTGERPYVCHLCDKRFINGGHLHTHMKIHTGEKNHVCSLCNKAFATAQQLTKHTIAIHTSERPYGCTYCNKRFASSSNLSTHIRIHTGEKNYHCDQCGKAFSTKGQLMTHMLVHTGEKHFLCDVCNKQFAQKAHLVRHMRVHRT